MASRLTVCAFAEMTYPERVAQHSQDMRVYRSLRPWARRFYLIVTSAGDTVHVSHDGNVVGIHVPYRRNVIVRRLQFWAVALTAGWRLSSRRRVNVFMAAEPLMGGPVALLLARLRRTPLLVHIQGDLLDLPAGLVGRVRAALIRRLTIMVARRADRVRCISRRIFDGCLEEGIPVERLAVLPVRCDFDLFDPASVADERDATRAGLQVGPRDILIVSVGALTVHKAYSVLLSAFTTLRQTGQNCRLVVIGEGPLRAALERQASETGTREAVSLPGWLAHERIPAMLGAADLYVQPSLDEGIPRAVLEAMAMEVPVVASRVGGIPELIQHGETGLLVPAGDPAALTAAMSQVIADRAFAQSLARAGRAYVRQQYDFAVGIRRYGGLLSATAERTPFPV